MWIRPALITLLLFLITGPAFAGGPPDICHNLTPNTPESIEAGCCKHNQCEEDGANKCVCSEQMENLNQSILDVVVAIEKLNIEKLQPSICKDKDDQTPHCRDLRAQEKTAWWARIGGITACLAFVGLMGTLVQQTIANSILRDTAQKQLRASLSVAGTRVTLQRDPAGVYLMVELHIQNVGQTPASNITMAAVAFTSDDKTADSPIDITVSYEDRMASGYLPQASPSVGLSTAVQGVTLSPKTAYVKGNNQIFSHNAKDYIILSGFIEFDDIYTVDKPKSPKRRIYIHRYGSIKEMVTEGGFAEMFELAWKESAT